MRYLFTTSTCHNCPEAKKYIFEHPELKIMVVEVDNNGQEGLELAAKYKIRQVPTFVIDEDGKHKVYTLQEFKDELGR